MTDLTPNSFKIIPASETLDNSEAESSLLSGIGARVGGLGGRLASTVTEAINKDANLVTDIINARLDSQSKTILSDFTFGSSDYSGAFKTGDITWNTTTGAITGGSGGLFNKNGLIFASAGVATITLDGTTGSATFAGDITGGTITIGTNAWHVDTSGNMWWGNYASYAAASNKISSTGLAYLTQIETAVSGGRVQIQGDQISILDAVPSESIGLDGSTGEVKCRYLTFPEKTAPAGVANEGKIYVKNDNKPYYIDEGNVEHTIMLGTLSGVADNEIFAYDSTSSVWINQTPAEIGLLDESKIIQSLVAGETIEANKSVYVCNAAAEYLAIDQEDYTFGTYEAVQGWNTGGGGDRQAGQSFTTSNVVNTITKCSWYGRRENTAVGNITFSLYASSISDTPTGVALATKTIDSSTISGVDVGWNDVTWTTPVSVSKSTKYVLTMSYNGGDATHYMIWMYKTSSVYSGGKYCISDQAGTNWSSDANKDFAFKIYENQGVAERVYKTRADVTGKYEAFIGFSTEAKNEAETIKIQTTGVLSSFTGLSVGSIYYLSDTLGTISTTPGSNTKKVGIATAPTYLSIINVI